MEFRRLKALLVVNPNSGPLHKRRMIPKTIKTLQNHFPELEIAFTRKRGDASEFAGKAYQRGVELFWCAGGDGTINEMVNALYGTGAILGIIPTGTGNGLAREIGLSMNPVRAVLQLIHGEVISVSPGVLNNRFFLLVSGAGYDAFVADQTDRHHPSLKKIIGFLSYIVVGALIGWRYPFSLISAKIDGKNYSCYGLLVMKSKARIGPLTLASSVSLQEKNLAVFLFKKKGLMSIFLFFIAFLFRVHLNLSFCPFILCKEIMAFSKDSVPVQCDGETTTPLPAVWKVSEKQILMIFPKGKK